MLGMGKVEAECEMTCSSLLEQLEFVWLKTARREQVCLGAPRILLAAAAAAAIAIYKTRHTGMYVWEGGREVRSNFLIPSSTRGTFTAATDIHTYTYTYISNWQLSRWNTQYMKPLSYKKQQKLYKRKKLQTRLW